MRIVVLSLMMVMSFLSTTSNAIIFDVAIDANQEVPVPALGGANPVGSATVDVNTITGAVSISGSFSGMTSDVAAAHLHGLSGIGETSGVVFGLTTTGGMAGTFTGSDVVSSDNLSGLLAGQTYINVHTANNGPGEIRGQVVDSDIKVYNLTLDPDQEVPAPTLNDSEPMGDATVVVDMSSGLVEISGSYQGMTSDVAAAHLHGPAPMGENAGVVFGLTVSGGTDGTFSGSDVLTNESLAWLLEGQTYINVHTANNGPGEIRGQVVPEPATGVLTALGAMCIFIAMRRRTR